MPTTSELLLPYPALGDPPNVPLHLQQLAVAANNLLGQRGAWRQDTTGQSVSTGTDTAVTFNTAPVAAVGLSYSGGVFTVSKTGRFHIKGSVTYPWIASLEMWAWLGPASTTTRWDLDTKTAPASSGPPQTLKVDITRAFTNGDTFRVWTWHNRGSSATLDVQYGGTTHFEATYLGAA